MPGFTPNFAIEYPCAGETIDATVFQTFADDVEAALAQVDAASAAALQRPRGQKLLSPGQSIASTVLTTLNYTSTVYASGITDTPTGFVILFDGVYMVTLDCAEFSFSAASNDYWSARVVRNATSIYQRKLTAPLTPEHPLNIGGLMTCVAGDVLSTQYQWQGGGGPLVVSARFSAAKVCDL